MNKKIPIVVGILVLIILVVLMSRSRIGSKTDTTEGLSQKSVSTASVLESVESSSMDKPVTTPVKEELSTLVDETVATELSALNLRVDEIQKESDVLERPSMLFDLMYEASMEEVMELLALSDSGADYSEGFRSDMRVAAYERWYHFDPAAAIRAADASALSKNVKNARIEVMLSNWASKSPQEVLTFLQQSALTDISSDHAYGAIVRGSAESGDRTAVDFALKQIQDEKMYLYGVKAAARIFQRDYESKFEQWLVTLSPKDQHIALAESAWILSSTDIDQALDQLNRLEELNAKEFPVTRARVVVKWAENDPVKAAEWVAAQELQGEDREILFSNLLGVWGSKDHAAAIAWAEGLIEEGIIDEAFMNRVAGRM